MIKTIGFINNSYLKFFFFFFIFVLLSISYNNSFNHFKGDGLYYYSYTVSILWDNDLELKNQYDHFLPYETNRTVTNENYYVNKKTGKVFSLFNPGTGFLMIPATFVKKIYNKFINKNNIDPYDTSYQKFAGYTSVIITFLSLLILYKIISMFYSTGLAIILPSFFLFGTNWFFYVVKLPSWSHQYALFCIVLEIWFFLKLVQKNNYFFGLAFGFISGFAFTIRNFNVIIFLSFFIYYIILNFKNKEKNKIIKLLFLICLAFLIASLPQLILNYHQHNSIFTSSFSAVENAQKSFGLMYHTNYKVLELSRLHLSYSTLFNSENGLFFYHILYFLGFLGFFFFNHSDNKFRNILNIFLFVVFIFWFVDAAHVDTWFNRAGSAGFGHRRFLNFIPFFVFGLANLLTFAKKNKFLRYIFSFLTSLALISGISMYYYYSNSYQLIYSNKYNFFNLYYKVLNKPIILIFIIFINIIILLILLKDRFNNYITIKKPLVIILLSLLIIIPAFMFKEYPKDLRKRHIKRGGFFRIYKRNNYVKLDERDWTLPNNGFRFLISRSGRIKLPAPLKHGDVVLFKMIPNLNKNEQGFLKLYIGNQLIDKFKLINKKHIYNFNLKFNPKEKRNIKIIVNGLINKSKKFYAKIFEGRIIYQEQNESIKGYLDLVIVDKGKITASGWCIDDHNIESIKLYCADRKNLTYYLGEVKRTINRPDVDKVFVLYPELNKVGYFFSTDLPNILTKTREIKCWVEILSSDMGRKKSRIVNVKIK